MKRTSKRVMAVAVSLAMVLTGSTSALAATTNPEISDREIEHKTAAKNIAAQGMVLLENKNNSLPISKEKATKIALFGQGVYNTIKGGTGSGAVNRVISVEVESGNAIVTAENGNRLATTLRENYGFAGYTFVRELYGEPETLERVKARVGQLVQELNRNDTTEKQAASAALLIVADELLVRLDLRRRGAAYDGRRGGEVSGHQGVCQRREARI